MERYAISSPPQPYHIYHFVLHRDMYNDLLWLKSLLKMSLSGTVIFVLKELYHLLEWFHFTVKEQDSCRELLDWDEDIWVYFNVDEKYLYRKVKHIHQDCNVHSMAIIVRYCLRYFIEGVSQHGLAEFLLLLKEKRKQWEKMKRKRRTWNKSISQLSGYQSVFSYIRVKYNEKNAPILIKLLE